MHATTSSPDPLEPGRRQAPSGASRRRAHRRVTPAGAVARGILAGVAGTAAMDLVQYLGYRKGGGTDGFRAWEFTSVEDFEHAPAPAQIGKRLAEGLLQSELPKSSAGAVNNVMHWGYGVAWGVPFGILAGSLRHPRLRHGPAFGTAVWLAGYVLLPPTGLYQPIWAYDARTLAKDWAGHLVYGTVAGAVLRALLAGASRG